jgi:phosphatidate cytidylyltransferase
MAFNFKTFQTRAITAVVFVSVMLTGLLWNQWSFLVLFSVIHFGCWIEYQKLIKKIDPDYLEVSKVHQYSIMVVGWGFMLWFTPNSYVVANLLLSDIGWWLLMTGLIIFIVNEYLVNKKILYQLTAHSLFGFVYISVSWALMMKLWGNLDHTLFAGENWVMPVLVIVSIWVNDTMAYLVGSVIGRTPFSAISPKKTWEGTIGGALLAVAFVTLVGFYGFHFDLKPLLLLSATAAIAGTAGDLLESKLKRMAGVKDSGQIMPGHGGFLDRFDSLLVATTLVWIVFRFIY